MTGFGGIVLAILTVMIASPSRADDGGLCRALKAAWTAARADPVSVKDVTLPAADHCSFSDDDLRCFWTFDGPEEAHRTYEGFAAVVTACFAPLGLSAVPKVLHGVETTSLKPEADKDPNIDIFYPPGSSIVGISVVTAP